MESGKYSVNISGHVTGQCVGDNQNITMSFGDEPLISTTQVSTQKPKTTRDSLVHWVDSGGNHFVGVLVGSDIKDLHVLSDIYVFPTRHKEGTLICDVPHSEERKPGTWHWIERAQGHD